MYKVKIGLDAIEHDQFIKNSNLPNLLQSSHWAKIKDNWKSEIIGFYENEDLVASCLILIRPLPLGFSMLYIPRGLAVDYSNQSLLKFIFSELKKYGKTQKALFAKFDPAIPYENSQEMLDNLTQIGIKYSGRTEEMSETIQPRFNAVIYREDFSEEQLDKKTKQFLRKGRNSYPTIEFGGTELISEFSDLMKKTESRKNVNLRNSDYYKKLLETYSEEAFITLIKYDMKAVKKDLENNLDKLQDNLTKVKNEKRQKSLTEEISIAEKGLAELSALIEEHGELVPVAGTLTINSFGAAETLYAGTDTAFQKYYPSYLAWYETIIHAFENGAKTLNMGGLENSLSEKDGLLKFKKHFKPRIEEYVGEFDIPVNPLLYKIAEKLYKSHKNSH